MIYRHTYDRYRRIRQYSAGIGDEGVLTIWQTWPGRPWSMDLQTLLVARKDPLHGHAFESCRDVNENRANEGQNDVPIRFQ